jgi:hypothetical protein
MECCWGSCRAWRFKKSGASALERQVSVRSDVTKQQVGLGHNLGAQNSSLDLNRTWDGTSLGLVQGLALQKEQSLRPGEALGHNLGSQKQQLGLE